MGKLAGVNAPPYASSPRKRGPIRRGLAFWQRWVTASAPTNDGGYGSPRSRATTNPPHRAPKRRFRRKAPFGSRAASASIAAAPRPGRRVRRRRATASAGRRACARASATKSALPRATMSSACFGFGDQADGDGGDAGRLLDRLRERHLVARAERDLLHRRHAARGRVDPVDAALLQLAGEDDGLRRCPSRPRPSRSPRRARRPACRAGNAARTASNTSSGKRMRFSSEPPYWSVRWLAIGDRNWCSR